MDNDNLQLNFNELIALLKDVKQALADKELNVKVDAPIVNVEPTPITVNERELPSEIKTRVVNLDELNATIKFMLKDQSKTLNIGNAKDFRVENVSVKNLHEIEKILKGILKKETQIIVKQDGAKVTVELPTSYNPRQYMPVRLTDGEQFYNAGGGGSPASGNKPVGLITFAFDEVKGIVYDGNDNVTQAKYYKAGKLLHTIDVTYNGDGNVTRAVLS